MAVPDSSSEPAMGRTDPVRVRLKLPCLERARRDFSTQCQEKSPRSVRGSGVATICGTPDLRTVDAALFGHGESNPSNLIISQ